MFAKLFAGVLLAGIMTGAFATAALAEPAGQTATTARHRDHKADKFYGTVVNVTDSQLVVRDRDRETRTFLRTEKTDVFRGRHEKASWSDIRTGDTVAVQFEERDGKLLARRVHLGLAYVRGKVVRVDGNVITIHSKRGEDITITVNADTKYFERTGKHERKPASLSDIKAGQHLVAAGRRDAGEGFDARIIVFSDKDIR